MSSSMYTLITSGRVLGALVVQPYPSQPSFAGSRWERARIVGNNVGLGAGCKIDVDLGFREREEANKKLSFP